MNNRLFGTIGLAMRPYRKAMTHEAAVAELLRVRGSELDEACVDAFIASQEVRHEHAA